MFALRRCTHLSQEKLYLHSSKRAISFSFLFFFSHAIKFYLPLNEKCHEIFDLKHVLKILIRVIHCYFILHIQITMRK